MDRAVRRIIAAVLAAAFVVAACTDDGAGSDPTVSVAGTTTPIAVSTSTSSSPSTTTSVAPTTSRVTTVPPPATTTTTVPDPEIEVPATTVTYGDVVDVVLPCSTESKDYRAYLTFTHDSHPLDEQPYELAPNLEEQRYEFEWAVPYWWEPGEVTITAQCPYNPYRSGFRAPSVDYPLFELEALPPVTITIEHTEPPRWDAWRPVVEPYLVHAGEPGSTLPGGAIQGPDSGGVDAGSVEGYLGQQVEIAARCGADADTSDARIVLIYDQSPFDQAMREYDNVPFDPPGQELWVLEFPATATGEVDGTIEIAATVVFDPDVFTTPEINRGGFYATALCSTTHFPADVRSVIDGGEDVSGPIFYALHVKVWP